MALRCSTSGKYTPFSICLRAVFATLSICLEVKHHGHWRKSGLLFALREGPQGLPTPVPFATQVNDANKPRFNHVAALGNVFRIMDVPKDRFTPAEREQWLNFLKSYPAKVEDVPADRLHPFSSSSSIAPCSLQLPSDFRSTLTRCKLLMFVLSLSCLAYIWHALLRTALHQPFIVNLLLDLRDSTQSRFGTSTQ
eukprot:6190307-Pleurochrysis_carterae.AAC.1